MLNYLPTKICSNSVASFLIRFHISIVKTVDAELNIEVKELIRAASITASIRPRPPVSR